MGTCQSRSCDSHLPICTTPPSSAPCPGPTANITKLEEQAHSHQHAESTAALHSCWFCALWRIASLPSLNTSLPAILEAFQRPLLISLDFCVPTWVQRYRWHCTEMAWKKTNQALKASESVLRVFCKPHRDKSQGPLLSDFCLWYTGSLVNRS